MLCDNCAILSYLIDKLQLILNWANIAVKQAGHEIHFATSTNTSTGKSSFLWKTFITLITKNESKRN